MRNRICISILLLGAPIALFACTIGLALGSATSDGRPLVFKNRDITNWSLEFRVDTPSGEHAYVRNSYAGSSTAWMGANEVGFAIVQSAAYNVSSSGGSGLSNGTMMNHALKNCTTVDDFEDILIATDGGGRSTAANYAVIDAYGNGAIFECSPYEYDRYDADTLGIVVRANFSYLGGTGRVGQNRMERAYDLMAEAIAGDSLDALYISKTVVSDLLYPDQDPYPLPWTGSFPGMPSGYVNTGPFMGLQTICNFNTLATGVVQGALAEGDPENTLMWCFFGQPVLSLPIPVFPAAHDEPSQLTGSPAPMRALAQAKSDSAFDHGTEYYLNTGFLLDEYYTGIHEYTIPTIEWAFDSVNSVLAEWETSPPSAAERSVFQDAIAEIIYDAYSDGVPMTVINSDFAGVPEKLEISAYPNPFNSALTIEYSAGAEIAILDLTGRVVGVPSANSDGKCVWRPTEDIPSGVYFVRLEKGKRSESRRVLFLK
ncbi:MAG: T9SS type A sorting domain-containing protein [bacterium]